MPAWTADPVLERLHAAARPGGREGMGRSGPDRAPGVRIPDLRRPAREIGTDRMAGGGTR